MEWKEIPGNPKFMRLPKKYHKVLIAKFGTLNGDASSVVVGYRNSHGDFITPGGARGSIALYWSDCLENDFWSPLWINDRQKPTPASCGADFQGDNV